MNLNAVRKAGTALMGRKRGKPLDFSQMPITTKAGVMIVLENYALFAFMAFSTSMLLFSPLEYLAMLMAIPDIWARA